MRHFDLSEITYIESFYIGAENVTINFRNHRKFSARKFLNLTVECVKFRNALFNNVYTMAGIIYSAAAFIFGIFSDRVGIVWVFSTQLKISGSLVNTLKSVISRTASLLLEVLGLTLLILG